MTLTLWVLVFLGSFFGGVMNALAGGGSFITIPLLIFAGLPPSIAIGTNRLALVFQTATATFRFNLEKKLEFKKVFLLSIPALIGAIIGAHTVLAIEETTLKAIIAVLLFANIPVIYAKEMITERIEALVSSKQKLEIMGALILLALGFYNGFFGAGVGFFFISTFLVFYRQEIVYALASRSLVAFLSSITAAIVFLSGNAVNFTLLIPLTLGFMAGAWTGAGLAIKKGGGFIKVVLVAVIIISTTKLLIG